MFKIYIIKENGKFKYLSFKRYEDSESIDDVFTYALIKDQYVNGRYFRTKVSLVRSDKSQEILKTLYTFHRSFFRICVDISFWLNILPKEVFHSIETSCWNIKLSGFVVLPVILSGGLCLNSKLLQQVGNSLKSVCRHP